ncbi:hypothetical protein BT96DRAFT_769598, partial [Gymnopus androsaceus JB14]
SYYATFEDELVILAHGINAYNAATRRIFTLRAYVILKLRDIVAIEEDLNLTGHNGFCPCRSCRIRGFRNITGGGKNYYTPLTSPNLEPDGTCRSWNPSNLPLRSHQDWNMTTLQIEATRSKKAADNIKFDQGIRGMPSFGTRVSSLDFVCSFPWDWMHQFKNIIQALVKFWKGKYKKLDAGTESFEISLEVWKEIGKETVAAVKTILSAFVRVLADIADKSYLYTAESWIFWFIHVAPIVLRGRFSDKKYYTHACELGELMKMTLKFTELRKDVEVFRERAIIWYRQYEESVV